MYLFRVAPFALRFLPLNEEDPYRPGVMVSLAFSRGLHFHWMNTIQ